MFNSLSKKLAKICTLCVALSTFSLSQAGALPHLIFGTWKTGNETYNLVVHAIKSGIRHIDTAQLYNNEAMVGRAVRQCIQDGTIDRKDIEITTKILPAAVDEIQAKEGCSYKQATYRLINESLNSLDLGYVDTILINDTCSDNVNELWKSLISYKMSHPDKIKKIGVSNFVFSWDIYSVEGRIPDVVQNPFFAGWRKSFDKDLHYDWRKCMGTQLEGYKALGHGILIENPLVKELAEKYNVSGAAICLKYCIMRGVSPVFSSRNPDHITTDVNLEFNLSDEELSRLDTCLKTNTICDIIYY